MTGGAAAKLQVGFEGSEGFQAQLWAPTLSRTVPGGAPSTAQLGSNHWEEVEGINKNKIKHWITNLRSGQTSKLLHRLRTIHAEIGYPDPGFFSSWLEHTALAGFAFSNGVSLKADLNFFQRFGEAGGDHSLPQAAPCVKLNQEPEGIQSETCPKNLCPPEPCGVLFYKLRPNPFSSNIPKKSQNCSQTWTIWQGSPHPSPSWGRIFQTFVPLESQSWSSFTALLKYVWIPAQGRIFQRRSWKAPLIPRQTRECNRNI